MSSIRQLAVAAAFCCAALPAAHAQVVTNLNYNLALTDAVIPDFHFDSGQPCDIHFVGDPGRYRTTPMRVTTGGTYNFRDAGYYDDPGGLDGSLGIYSGSFNPASPAVNCVASVDDDQDVTLTAGTYTLVLSAWDGISEIPGAFHYTIDGPAAVALSSSGAVAAVPTLAEWSLGLLAALAAALGWRGMRRRNA